MLIRQPLKMKNGCELTKNRRYTICDPPRENQQKGDNTGTRAMHGHASVTTDTDMRIFNDKTESVTEAFVWQDITR